jgi:hypothetical protein
MTHFVEDAARLDLNGDLMGARGAARNPNQRKNDWTIEERIFVACLMLFETHFAGEPPIGQRTMRKSTEMIQDTLNRSLTKPEVRYVFN